MHVSLGGAQSITGMLNTGTTTPAILEREASLSSVHHQSYVVAFQEYPSQRFPGVLLNVDFLSILENQVHVLIKADDTTLDPHILLLEKPDLDARFALEEPKDEVDGLGHDTLNLGGRHGCYCGVSSSSDWKCLEASGGKRVGAGGAGR